MKRIVLILLAFTALSTQAQSNVELVKHYEAYYKQMRSQADIQGIINAMTHLNILSPSQARKDTLAYIYMSENKHVQALNTVGIDVSAADSNIAAEVKAVSLKALNQTEKAIPHFEKLFNKSPNARIAYELAELNIQLKKITEANKHITYGLANVKDDMKQAFYETQQPYQVSLKAAFMYLKALAKFNENTTTNIDAALDLLDAALKLEPNFNMAQISKNALLSQKQSAAGATNTNN